MTGGLKPCPFCGGAELAEISDGNNWPVVRCDDCGALGPCTELDRTQATALWNHRAVGQSPNEKSPPHEGTGSR